MAPYPSILEAAQQELVDVGFAKLAVESIGVRINRPT
jgi:hypothetical protein